MCGGGGGGGDQGPTPQEEEMQRVAEEEWGRFKEQFLPVEQAYIAEIQAFDQPEARMDLVAEQANVVQRSNAMPAAAGMDPNSGAGFSNTLQRGLDTGMNASRGVASADLATDARKLAGQQSAIALGRNIKDTASVNLTRSAQQQAAIARQDTLAAADLNRSNSNAFGQVAGLGLGAYKAYQNRNPVVPTYNANPLTTQATPAPVRDLNPPPTT